MHVGMIYHPPLPRPTTGVAFDAFQVGFSYRSDHKGIIFIGEIASLRCSCSCCLRRLPINPSIIRYMHLSSSAVIRAIMTPSAAVYRILFLFRCEDTARLACVAKCFAVDSCGALRRITSALRCRCGA